MFGCLLLNYRKTANRIWMKFVNEVANTLNLHKWMVPAGQPAKVPNV